MIGQTVAHYQIVERLGAGGMGEVYRAHDLQLDRDVALKVLPGGALSEESVRKQFRTEALALAKLNHPNIATVHEFSIHEGLDFIAMELIAGTTLRQKLVDGSLSEKDILRLGAQLAEGLAAAHEHRVVHRDLKPGNLMITPDGRLKILDFGLARLLRPAEDTDLTQSITAASDVTSGTVPYMSPEQLRGLPGDPRSDIYAAGAVLYEMATGRRPFPQTQGMELVGAILHTTPDPPSAHNPRVTSSLERVILKALEKEPEQRYQSARELQVAIEAVQPGLPAPALERRRPIVAAAAAALVLVPLGVILGLNLWGSRDRLWRGGAAGGGTAAVAPVKSRHAVAVLGFKNVSGRPDDAWLSTALSEMMTTELAAGEQLQTIPGENVARMRISLTLPEADSYGKDTLAKIRHNLNADHVVLGSYIPLGGGQMRLDLRLQATNAGEILLATSVKGDETQMDHLVSVAAGQLRERLGAGKVTPADAVAIRATLAQNRDTMRHYAIGLERLRQFNYLRARESLEQAVAVEPQYALAHSALAVALKALGYDKKASEEAKKAFDLSKNFSREERLWIEARYHETTNAWAKAVETYRTLVDFFPDNLEYGLRLVSTQTSAGKGKEALAAVDVLRALPPPASEDARIDLVEAAAASSLGDFKRQQAAAVTAVSKADAQGARLLAAYARISECSSLRYLGKPKESIARCEEARQILAAAGDRSAAARAFNTMAVVHMEQGDLNEAKKAYNESLAVTREIGDKRSQAMVLNNLAGVLRGQGDLTGSRKMLEEALANLRDVDDKGGVARSLDNIGIVLLDEGKPEAARRSYEQSLAICREIGHRSLIGYALYLLGEVHIVQGDLQAARQRHTEALALRKEISDQRAIADSELALASLSIEAEQFAAAESAARARVEAFHKAGATDNEALARAVLARAQLAQGKIAEATAASSQAVALAQKTEDTTVRLTVAIEAARVRAASGNRADVADATKVLKDAVADATKEGLTGLLLQARLALGQVEIAHGDRASGRSRLVVVRKEATAKGFVLVARKASAALRAS
jgi:tetratricopeptide (TPR) repeat protein/TolB-like protein